MFGLNFKVIFAFVSLLSVSTVGYIYLSYVNEKQEVKIEQLEDNITFTQLDHHVEVENSVTDALSKERNETLTQILGSIYEKNTTHHDTNYTDAIFDRVWFQSQIP